MSNGPKIEDVVCKMPIAGVYRNNKSQGFTFVDKYDRSIFTIMGGVMFDPDGTLLETDPVEDMPK